MITINNEPKAYTPIFLGTTQHSLRLSLEILIMVGMKLNDEIIGSELSGFKAKISQSDAKIQNTVSTELENLIDLKNVGQYQLLKGLKDMTQELNVPELSNNNLILMRQLLEVTQSELAKKNWCE